MNSLFRIKEYLRYFSKARGIGNMHSPFVYEFMKQVLNDNRYFYAYDEIESLRNRLLTVDDELTFIDYGAGASSAIPVKRSIKELIKSSSKPAAQAQLLFRLAIYFQCRQIIEMGTSLGFTSMYLAASGLNAEVITLEGATAIAERALKNFNTLGFKNIEMKVGLFDSTLKIALQQKSKPDLIFFDGNHRLEPTLNYFQQSMDYITNDSIFVFDDIHWSPEMVAAWKIIKAHSKITLTLDLFYFGIVFFRKELSKQDFIIRY